MITFQEFPKIARLSREMIITEKIDGTNGQIIISDDWTEFAVASRSRLITPEQDNYGFAQWAMSHKDELMKLGPGRHFGEWWGCGIQRKYGMAEKVFSLFNVERYGPEGKVPLPSCCRIVPTLYRGEFDTNSIIKVMEKLKESGSVAAPGFMNPEGIVIFHTHGRHLFKKTFEKDSCGKGNDFVVTP